MAKRSQRGIKKDRGERMKGRCGEKERETEKLRQFKRVKVWKRK